jgi:hypothetical protein
LKHMKRLILTAVAVLCLSATVLAQNQAALAILAQLDTEAARAKPGVTRNTLRELLADLRVLLEMPVPPCPEPEPCPDCPPPVECPVEPEPVACVVSLWGEWSAWAPVSVLEESRTRTRTVVTPAANGGAACPVLTETETRAIVLPPVGTVTTAAELNAALAAKRPVIEVAGTLTGNWTITYPVTVTGPTAPCAALGVNGRVKPADVAGAQLVALDKFIPTVTIADNGAANDVKFHCLTITGVAPDRTVFLAGTDFATDVNMQPKRLTLDQVAVLGVNGWGHRGVEAHVAGLVLTNSHIAGFLERNRQSQGFHAANGPGPFRIENNYIEASGENILFGGNDPRVKDLIPSDIIIRNNLLYKPLDQYPSASVANLLELKNAQRVLIEGNTMDGSRIDIQTGHAIVLTPRNQYGKAPWSTVRDVIIRKNIVKNYSGHVAQNLCTDNNFPSGMLTNVTYEGNLFLGSNAGIQVNNGVSGDLKIIGNTMPNTTWAMISFNGPVPAVGAGSPCRPNFTWSKNVMRSGQYGINSQNGGGQGSPSITAYTTPVLLTGNVIEQSNGTTFFWQRLPSGNTLLDTPGALVPLLDADGHYIPGGAGW